MKVRFTVLGEPRGKGRPRFARAGNYVRTYTPDETVSYENLIKLEYRRQCGNFQFERDVPLDLRIFAYFTIPKSASKKKHQEMVEGKLRPLKKSDADNIIKVVADAANGVIFHDDVQIVDCQLRKFYSEKPRLVVCIQEAEHGERENVKGTGI